MAKAKGVKDKGATERGGTTEQQSGQVSPQERERMIAEAAYFRAQARGFQGGDPIDDWLAAEAEVNRLLPTPQQQKEEQAAYDQLRAEVQKGFAGVRDPINAQVIQDTLERSAAHLKKAGGYAIETINKVAESLKKDIAGAATLMGPRWEAFSDRGASLFAVWRDRGSVFLARAAGAVGDWLNETGRRLERPQYRTGEMVGSGSFECLQCRDVVRLETSAHLPACPKCRHLEFRRTG